MHQVRAFQVPETLRAGSQWKCTLLGDILATPAGSLESLDTYPFPSSCHRPHVTAILRVQPMTRCFGCKGCHPGWVDSGRTPLHGVHWCRCGACGFALARRNRQGGVTHSLAPPPALLCMPRLPHSHPIPFPVAWAPRKIAALTCCGAGGGG